MSSDGVDPWTKTQTIASLVALIAIFLAILALVNERIQRARNRDEGSLAADRSKMEYFFVPRLSHWSAFHGSKTEILKITSIQGLIKAGDSHLWTSAALDQLLETTFEICWVSLYKNIFSEVSRRLNTKEARENLPTQIRIFLDRAHERMYKEARELETTKTRLLDEEQQLTHTRKTSITEFKLQNLRKRFKKHRKSYVIDRNHYYDSSPPDLVNCCRKLDVADHNAALESEAEEYGLEDVQPTWLVGGKPCIATSREELAALALVLGMSLKWHAYAPSLGGTGAFGTSLRAAQENGTWRLHLMQATRIPRHARSPGSGYTILMAKHIACGSLPFADASDWVRSIFVTEFVLKGIRTGGSVKDVQSYGGPALEYLRRLPGAKEIDAYYDIAPNLGPDDSLGIILRSDNSPFPKRCTWARAVAGIAFGGLVPQAAEYLAQAVSFTVAGTQGKCFEELELLINKLHEHSTTKGIFGGYVSERVGALASVDHVNYTLPARSSDVRDAAAVFARYMTLLERVTARCEITKDRVNAIFEASCTLIHRVYVSAVRKDEASKAERETDLGLAVRTVKERLQPGRRIPLYDCAVVVRAIIAAWAWQVPYIKWPDSMTGGTSTAAGTWGNTTTESSVNRLVSLDDIPPVSALG